MIAFIFGSIGLLVPASVGAQSPNQHCVAELKLSDFGEQSVMLDRGCYATEAEATFVATGGKVSLPVGASREEAKAMIEAANEAQAAQLDASPDKYLLVKFYDGENRTGSTLEVYGDADCPTKKAQGQYFWGNMASNWDNRAASAEGYSQCRNLTVWDLPNRQGPTYSCRTDLACGTFFGLNDTVTSWRIDPL
jgi:hypothetical protein